MKLVQRKKVSLHDIAAPKPSRAASRAVRSALKGAYKDQQATLKKAYSTK
jgi:hypothetical protein